MKAKIYLFSSPTCPHCPAAEKFLRDFSNEREDIITQHFSTATPQGQKKAQQYQVMGVPTFIIKGPGYPENIGLTGIQSSKVMHKYVDIALGKRKVEEKKEKSFGIGKFRIKF